MKHVFLSYVKEDSVWIDLISVTLEMMGINVWIDKTKINAGEFWKDSIRNAIKEGAFFIVCFSDNYMKKDSTFAREELILAIDELRLRPFDKSWFIPIRLSDCKIPDLSIGAGKTLRDIQHIDMFIDQDAGLQKLADVLLATLRPNELATFNFNLAVEQHINNKIIHFTKMKGKLFKEIEDSWLDLLDKKRLKLISESFFELYVRMQATKNQQLDRIVEPTEDGKVILLSLVPHQNVESYVKSLSPNITLTGDKYCDFIIERRREFRILPSWENRDFVHIIYFKQNDEFILDMLFLESFNLRLSIIGHIAKEQERLYGKLDKYMVGYERIYPTSIISTIETAKLAEIIDQEDIKSYHKRSKNVKTYIKRSIIEKNICTIDFSNWIQDSLIISPDSKHLAYYLAKQGEDWHVVLDGHEFKKYSDVDSLVFSPDSCQIAYQAIEINLIDHKTVSSVAKVMKKSFVVVNDMEMKNYYDDIAKNAIVFSPDSKHLSYAARKGNGWLVVRDGNEGPKYDGIGTIIFSPNSERLAYSARLGNNWLVVDDGIPQKKYDQIGKGSLIFSPNSKKLVYAAKENGKWFIVEDGKEKSEKCEGVGQPVFSSNSEQLAYVIAQNDLQMLIVNDNAQEKFTGVSTPVFSPNSKDYAYIAGDNNKMFVVFNKDKMKKYDGIVENSLLFSPNSESFVHVALNKKALENKYYIIRDNEEINIKYDGIGDGTLIFSPDSKHFAFGIERENKWCMVVDNNICKEYDGIGSPVFSPDSKYFAYVAVEDGRFCLIINENKGKDYSSIITIAGGKVIFDSPNSLHYITQKADGSFSLIQEKIIY